MSNKKLMPKLISFFLLLVMACSPRTQPEDGTVWKKVKINLSRFDTEGLSGGADGKVAGNYEFCIPKEEKKWKTIQKIDATAQKNDGRGRIGCTDQQWLVIGSTHQKNYRRVLYELASLDFIEKIEETHWE
jgi:hypothetical protein